MCRELIAFYIDLDKCARGCDACVGCCPTEAIFTTKKSRKKAERWREELIRFHNEKRLVERLRDKVRQEWLREQEKSFFKEMDELTILKTKVSE